jgi:hypothetical protein
VTSGGWVLTSSLELNTNLGRQLKQNAANLSVKRSKVEVIFQSNPVRCYSNEGKAVDTIQKSWSLPLSSNALRMCIASNGGYFVETVPDVSMILPNRDNRVAGEQQVQLIRNSAHKPSVHFICHSSPPIVSKIPLPRRMFGEGLSSIAVHPNNEWIVIGSVNFGLIVLNAR